MNVIYSGLLGVFVGAAVGIGASQLRVPPLVQSVGAVLVAVLLTTGLIFFLWLRYLVPAEAGGGYFGFGTENLLSLGVLLTLSGVLHGLLGLSGIALPWFAEHRSLILGCAGGLYSSVSVARALETLSSLNSG